MLKRLPGKSFVVGDICAHITWMAFPDSSDCGGSEVDDLQVMLLVCKKGRVALTELWIAARGGQTAPSVNIHGRWYTEKWTTISEMDVVPLSVFGKKDPVPGVRVPILFYQRCEH
jgi:hypothetical protein